jgi:hypothetical protein
VGRDDFFTLYELLQSRACSEVEVEPGCEEARDIFNGLRDDATRKQVTYFTVGRERWLSIIEDDLTNYIAAGGATVRFLNGDYGDGKTHTFCRSSSTWCNRLVLLCPLWC